MGMTTFKKGLWVVVLFSLALNVGFVFMTIRWKFMPRFTPPRPPLVQGGSGTISPGGQPQFLDILDRIDLTEDIREEVKENLIQMVKDHRKFLVQLSQREKRILTLIGRPGDLTMETVSPLIESYSRARKENELKTARHIIEIRKLLGRERSVYLISELKKEFDQFDKRLPEDKPRD